MARAQDPDAPESRIVVPAFDAIVRGGPDASDPDEEWPETDEPTVDSAPADPADPTPSAAPGPALDHQAVDLRADARLRTRPKLDAPVLVEHPRIVLLRGSVTNSEGTWWYADLGGGRTGWVLERDVIP